MVPRSCGEVMLTPPNLPADFYTTERTLAHIHQAAEATLVSPDAMLAALLARVAAGTPTEATVNDAPLNYISAIIGGSGTGKSAAVRTARRLLPNIGTDLDNLPVSSGEGLVQAYMTREDGENRQRYTAGLFYVDEGESLLRVAGREGSTTLATLRTLWSGESTGSTGAQSNTTRRLQADAYRFALVVGIQPAYAMTLLADDHAGTPQRFLWMSAGNPHAPDREPAWPGEISLVYPSAPLHLPAAIRAEVNEERRTRLRSNGPGDPLQSHSTQLALRIAGLLAVLCGRPSELTAEDWERGRIAVEHSRRVIQSLIDARAAERRAEEQQQDQHYIERRLHKKELEHQGKIERIAEHAGRLLTEKGPMTRGRLRSLLRSTDRPHSEEAFQHAITRGLIAAVDQSRLGAGPLA